jgi:hypothetical protein
LLLLLGALAGCGPTQQHARVVYDTAGLDVERVGWDTLRVRPTFTRRTSLSETRPAQPESTFVYVFGARYDTLYAGPADAAVSLPDRRLASREPLLVEACGLFRRGADPSDGLLGRLFSKRENTPRVSPSVQPARTHPESTSSHAFRAHPESTSSLAFRALCEQTTVFASPKRVRADTASVTFPEDADFQRGRYDVRFIAERRSFRDTTYELLGDGVAAGGYLLARAAHAQGRGTVRVPISESGRGTFDLSRYDGYDDFRYYLRAAMERGERHGEGEPPAGATVAFEVLAGLDGAVPQSVRRFSKDVRRLTTAERRRQAQRFAQSAAAEIAERLLPGESDDARATVRGWRYNRLDGRYEVDLRVRWYERDDFGDRYTLEGALRVSEGSRRAHFVGEEGNRRAVRRWRRTVDGDELPLGVLEERPEDAELPEVDNERLRDVADRRRAERRRSKLQHSHDRH